MTEKNIYQYFDDLKKLVEAHNTIKGIIPTSAIEHGINLILGKIKESDSILTPCEDFYYLGKKIDLGMMFKLESDDYSDIKISLMTSDTYLKDVTIGLYELTNNFNIITKELYDALKEFSTDHLRRADAANEFVGKKH